VLDAGFNIPLRNSKRQITTAISRRKKKFERGKPILADDLRRN
jgi:hypothetical protein